MQLLVSFKLNLIFSAKVLIVDKRTTHLKETAQQHNVSGALKQSVANHRNCDHAKSRDYSKPSNVIKINIAAVLY